jgi:hypothetical protein
VVREMSRENQNADQKKKVTVKMKGFWKIFKIGDNVRLPSEFGATYIAGNH